MIRTHIARSLALLLLVTAGVVLTQLHDTLHLVEDIVVSADHHDGTPDQKSDHEECLNCIITFFSADLPSAITAPDYSSEEIFSIPNVPFIKVPATKHIRLRAPPVTQFSS